MKFIFSIVNFSIIILASYTLKGQEFIGDSKSVYKDSSIIKAWATEVVNLKRGYINISDTNLTVVHQGVSSNIASFGTIENVLGKANGQTISLGDGGEITLSFQSPIKNGNGSDFAIFENGFFSPPNQNIFAFIELAFVEVSSDGENFFRFPSISNQQTEMQVTSFQATDYRLYENLAGNYPVFWGTAFDLEDLQFYLADNNTLDLDNIIQVKIIDVVGSINLEYANYDSQENIINEAFPTPFASCGFDLDAVAVINENEVYINENFFSKISIFPNPAKEFIIIKFDELDFFIDDVIFYDLSGQITKKVNINSIISSIEINVSDLKPGIYFIKIGNQYKKIIIG